MAENINTAIIERLEKVVESLQDNSVKMGQLLAVHDEKLTKQEGFDPHSDEYYSEIDKRIKLDFPHKFARKELSEGTTKPTQTVASATRSVKPGRTTVRLTSSQVAIAKKLGVPLEEYAKQLKITKEA